MGEAGAEGILPLKRMASGDLGVQAEGGGDNVTNIFYVNALDVQTFAEYFGKFTKENPQAITGPLMQARMGGARI